MRGHTYSVAARQRMRGIYESVATCQLGHRLRDLALQLVVFEVDVDQPTALADAVGYRASQLVAGEVEVLQVVAVADRVRYRTLEQVVEKVEHAKVGQKA